MLIWFSVSKTKKKKIIVKKFLFLQSRLLFSSLMENCTLKDVKILYPTFFFKLSPLQIDQFGSEEWANETAISLLEKAHLSYPAAKQVHIFSPSNTVLRIILK